MKMYYITFRSVTFAQRGERALKNAGISCTLQRTPRWMEEQGCGYALHLRTQELAKAAQILQEKKIPMRRMYAQKEDGGLEEVQL